MLVTLEEVLNHVLNKKCGIGAFKTLNLETITVELNAAEKLDVAICMKRGKRSEENCVCIGLYSLP